MEHDSNTIVEVVFRDSRRKEGGVFLYGEPTHVVGLSWIICGPTYAHFGDFVKSPRTWRKRCWFPYSCGRRWLTRIWVWVTSDDGSGRCERSVINIVGETGIFVYITTSVIVDGTRASEVPFATWACLCDMSLFGKMPFTNVDVLPKVTTKNIFAFVDLNERSNLIQSTIWIKSDGHFYKVWRCRWIRGGDDQEESTRSSCSEENNQVRRTRIVDFRYFWSRAGTGRVPRTVTLGGAANLFLVHICLSERPKIFFDQRFFVIILVFILSWTTQFLKWPEPEGVWLCLTLYGFCCLKFKLVNRWKPILYALGVSHEKDTFTSSRILSFLPLPAHWMCALRLTLCVFILETLALW
jgi:hypothetical protein